MLALGKPLPPELQNPPEPISKGSTDSTQGSTGTTELPWQSKDKRREAIRVVPLVLALTLAVLAAV